MTVKSIFEYKFPKEHSDEGLAVAKQIGQDMVPLAGYVDHEVLQDVKNPGHIIISTEYSDEAAAWAVLDRYKDGPKIAKIDEMAGDKHSGFVASGGC